MCQNRIFLSNVFVSFFIHSSTHCFFFRFRFYNVFLSCSFLAICSFVCDIALTMAASSSLMDLEKLFGIFLDTYKKFHVSINGQAAQQECSTIWRNLKQGRDFESTKAEAEKVMSEWKAKAKVPGKGSIASLWSRASTKKKGKA